MCRSMRAGRRDVDGKKPERNVGAFMIQALAFVHVQVYDAEGK